LASLYIRVYFVSFARRMMMMTMMCGWYCSTTNTWTERNARSSWFTRTERRSGRSRRCV